MRVNPDPRVCPWCDRRFTSGNDYMMHTEWERKREQGLIPEDTPDPVPEKKG